MEDCDERREIKMKKAMIQKIVLISIFLIGGLVFTYPFYSNGINYVIDQQRLKVLHEQTETEHIEKEKKMNALNEKIKVQGLVINHDPFDVSQVDKKNLELKNHLIGSISIPKIDVTIPLFDTLSNQVLENGAGVLQGSSMPTGGKNTHSVISAHRGLAERLLFRNLDKLEKGDIFIVESAGKLLAYEVFQIQTVKPEETDFIKLQPTEDLVSLLTCTPYMINSHRLIVTGKRTEVTKALEAEVRESQKKQNWQQWLLLLAIILGILIIFYLIYRVIRNYLISQNKYSFTFYLRDHEKTAIEDQEFIIYRKGSNKILKRKGEFLVPLSQLNGRVVIKDLPGGVYRLSLRDKPRQYLGQFGVKKLKETRMSWLKTETDLISIKEKNRRLWITIRKN